MQKFLDVIDEKDTFEPPLTEDLKVLTELRHFEGRMDCVTLSWKAMLEYLEEKID